MMDILYLCNTWTLLVIIISTLYTATGFPELSHTANTCFKQSQKTLTLTCPPDHMVKVTRMLQGTSDEDRCEYRDGDCIYDMKHDYIPCVGRQHCQINLPSGDTGLAIHTCKTHGTYMQVDYTCVNVADVTDICSTGTLHGESGYITTPNYPSNYPDSRRCKLHIEPADENLKLIIFAIDMRLESASERGCGDVLYLYDGHRGATLCGSDARKQLMVTMENYVQIEFISNATVRDKGFWLYYQAVKGKRPMIIETTTTTTITTTSPERVTSPTINETLVRHNTEHTTELPQQLHNPGGSNFSIGVLVGILVGIVLCVICIVILVLYMKRRQRNMSKKVIGKNTTIAAMASSIEKPVPTQTLNNLHYPHKPHNTEHKLPDKDVEMNNKDEIPKYLGPFIDTNLSTGEEQLIC